MVVLLTLTRHAQRRIVQAAAVAASDANAGSRILVVTAWSHSGGAGPRPAAASRAARFIAPFQFTHAGSIPSLLISSAPPPSTTHLSPPANPPASCPPVHW